MPQLRRPGLPRRHTARQRTVTRAMLEYLQCGRNYLRGDILVRSLGRGFGPDPDVDEMRAAWKQCRDELLAAARPGLRPWGWWEFDSPEPRAPATSAGTGWWTEGLREHETLQLLRMDEIGEIELLELKREWALYIGAARTPALRQHYGIPESWYSSEFEHATATTEHSEA